jgi:hypothetical protein
MTVIMRCGGTDAILESIATLDSIALAGVRAHGGDELQPGCSPTWGKPDASESPKICELRREIPPSENLVGTHKYT